MRNKMDQNCFYESTTTRDSELLQTLWGLKGTQSLFSSKASLTMILNKAFGLLIMQKEVFENRLLHLKTSFI